MALHHGAEEIEPVREGALVVGAKGGLLRPGRILPAHGQAKRAAVKEQPRPHLLSQIEEEAVGVATALR